MQCGLRKAWACCSQGAVSDEGIDAQEVDPYLNYLRHVMYYHDRWSSKLWGSDAFLETIVHVIRKLEALKRDTSDKRQKYLKVLEQIHDHTSELAEHALRVTLLANTEHHSEFEALVAKEGALTLKSLSQTLVRHSTSFWCTDFGQVLYSALVRADPQRFKPVGVGVEVAARTWSLWTDELGTIKTYEYSSPEEARLVLEQCRCCTILVGPEGKIQEKSFASSTSQVLSKASWKSKALMDTCTAMCTDGRTQTHMHAQAHARSGTHRIHGTHRDGAFDRSSRKAAPCESSIAAWLLQEAQLIVEA